MEIETAVKAFNRFKVESWCINAEEHYKTDQTSPELAELLVSGIKRSMPGVKLGYTTYRYPEYHRTFNWDPFVKYCDYTSPQIYWVGATNPAAQLDKCISQYAAIKSTVPIIPIGCAYPDNGWNPTPAQMNEFYNRVVDLNLLGWSWWEWNYILAKPDWLATITNHGNINNTPGSNIAPDLVKQLILTSSNLLEQSKLVVQTAEELYKQILELQKKI